MVRGTDRTLRRESLDQPPRDGGRQQRIRATSGLADRDDQSFCWDDQSQASPDELLIVSDRDANHGAATSRGNCARSPNLPFASSSTARRPPWATTRWRIPIRPRPVELALRGADIGKLTISSSSWSPE